MVGRIEYEAGALKDLKKIDRSIAKRIVSFPSDCVSPLDDPHSIGAALHGSELGDLWRYRVGDYRIICEIRDHELVILAISIGHRREIYR